MKYRLWMPDAIFDHPRVARVYDPLDPDRSDLDTYLDLVDEFGATAVLDVGCGTGTFCSLLAGRGIRGLGVDPARASVAVARTKVGVGRMTWVVGTAVDVASDPGHRHRYDLATMTAHVAQVFLDDAEWLATLRAVRMCLRPGGHVAFESRVPSDRGWERWTKELTHRVVEVEGEGPVEDWVQVTKVEGEFVTFDSPTIFLADGERVESTSTLRFRPQEALHQSLSEVGFTQIEIRELPYAPTRLAEAGPRRSGTERAGHRRHHVLADARSEHLVDPQPAGRPAPGTLHPRYARREVL